MVSEADINFRVGESQDVLILVLMEHGLGVKTLNYGKKIYIVLILVLMEHGLGVTVSNRSKTSSQS